LLPSEHLRILLSYGALEGQRDIVLSAAGAHYNAIMDRLLALPQDSR
jgi:hypothetical protein